MAAAIQKMTEIHPTIGIICGSGLGGLAEDLDSDKPKDVISYKDIPRFPKTTGRYCHGIINHFVQNAYNYYGVYKLIVIMESYTHKAPTPTHPHTHTHTHHPPHTQSRDTKVI